MRKAMIIGALTLSGALASPAFADEYSGFRLGLGLGEETMKSDVGYLAFGTERFDQTRFTYSVFGGWALNKWFAVEAAYQSGSEFSQTMFVDPDNFPFRDIPVHYDIKAFVPSVVGSWWVTPKFGIYGRAGVYAWKGEFRTAFDDDVTVNPPGYSRTSFDDDGFEPLLGVGLQTELDTAIIRVEYQMTQFDDHNEAALGLATADTTVSSVNLSIVWTLH